MTTKTRIAAIALSALLPLAAQAALNEGVFTYSGTLHNAAGGAETTAQSVTFTLYDAASAGNAVWTQTLTVQPDSQGWFSAVLGASPNALPHLQFVNQLHLGIKVGVETEMTPRTKMGTAPNALSVDWSGVLNLPAPCTGSQVLQGYNASGVAVCVTPGASGVTSVTKAATAGNPLVVTGTSTVALDLPAAGAAASGYLGQADWATFNAKAPSANPTFTGTVTAPTFSGALSGNAASATNATNLNGQAASFYQPASTAITTSNIGAQTVAVAGSANAVAANALTPTDLNTSVAATAGQVPSRAATDTFTWVTPVTGVSVTAPVTNGGTATAPVIGIQAAGTASAGALSAADWNSFNNKVSPIAYGFVTGAGARNAGSTNWSAVWNAAGPWYEITITGVSYFFSTFTTTVTPVSGPYVSATSSVSGKLLVQFFNLAGTSVQTANGFAFVVF